MIPDGPETQENMILKVSMTGSLCEGKKTSYKEENQHKNKELPLPKEELKREEVKEVGAKPVSLKTAVSLLKTILC